MSKRVTRSTIQVEGSPPKTSIKKEKEEEPSSSRTRSKKPSIDEPKTPLRVPKSKQTTLHTFWKTKEEIKRDGFSPEARTPSPPSPKQTRTAPKMKPATSKTTSLKTPEKSLLSTKSSEKFTISPSRSTTYSSTKFTQSATSTPSKSGPSSIVRAIHQKHQDSNKEVKKEIKSPDTTRARGRPRLPESHQKIKIKSNRPVGRPTGTFKVLQTEPSTPLNLTSVKRIPCPADLPAVRNQSDFYNCVICKDPTLLRTAESKKRIEVGKEKVDVDPLALNIEEDPALSCVRCHNHFHLVCVFDEPELITWALENPKKFYCQECIRCLKCNSPIYDPGNVQCIKCGAACHENCKVSSFTQRDSNIVSRTYTCPSCASPKKHKEISFAHSKGMKRKVIASSPKTPEIKKMKIQPKSGNKEDVVKKRNEPRSPKVTSKPKSSKVKQETYEEFETKRQDFINNLIESIRPDAKINCIGSQDTTFSTLTEEFLDEEEKKDDEEDDMDYVSYGKVADYLKNGEGKKKEQDVEPVFFYGNVAYKPKFHEFLNTILPTTERVGFCHRCFSAQPSLTHLMEHTSVCEKKHPPGTKIYHENNLQVWEINGATEKIFCRRLSLFAKTFIGSKAVHFEVEGFKFYVLIETTAEDYHVAGYFSKEIQPIANNNLSCLLVLPWMQRKQYGLFLIDLSYQLSIRERKIGSPEHPLSDAGLKTYRQYWYAVLMSYLREKLYDSEPLSLREMREETGIDTRDILETMIIADMTFILNDKLQINIETPYYATLSSLRRRYVKPKLLKVSSHPNLPFTSYS